MVIPAAAKDSGEDIEHLDSIKRKTVAARTSTPRAQAADNRDGKINQWLEDLPQTTLPRTAEEEEEDAEEEEEGEEEDLETPDSSASLVFPSQAGASISGPSPWHPITSGDLAFLARLPIPCVTQSSVSAPPQTLDLATPPQSRDGKIPADEDAEKQMHPEMESPTRAAFLLSAASRQWEGLFQQETVFERRDVWAIGSGWGRHVRVVEGRGSGGKIGDHIRL